MRIAKPGAAVLLCSLAVGADAQPIPGAPAPPKKLYHSLRYELAGGAVIDPTVAMAGVSVAKILHPYVDLGVRADAIFADGATLVDVGAEARIFHISASGGTGYNGPDTGFKGRILWLGGAPYVLVGLGAAFASGEQAFAWRAGAGFDKSVNGWLAFFVEGGAIGSTDDAAGFLRAGARL